MRIFCDTNIIVEFLEERQYSSEVQAILSADDNEYFLSLGEIYTLSYLADRHFRKEGVQNPERTVRVKQQLAELLEVFQIADLDKEGVLKILENDDFYDIEDGFQYQAALACQADVLLTINIKDFMETDKDNLNIMTPEEFATKYL